MKSEKMTEAEFNRLYEAYEGLVEWVQHNRVDGQETLGLLLKAASGLAVINDLPKHELVEVLSATYDMESLVRCRNVEMH